MNDDPIRLRDDPARGRALREDLEAAAAATLPAVDLVPALAKLEASLRRAGPAGGAPAIGGAAAGGGGLVWGVAIVGIAGLVVAAFLVSTGGDTGEVRRRAGPAAARHEAPRATARSAPAEAEVVPPETPAVEAQGPSLTAARASPSPPPSPRRGVGVRAHGDTLLTPVDPVTREIELVGEARARLSGDPAAALAAAETAGREVPGGALAEEREALAILALHALGRNDEARRRATAYLGRWPAGTQSARVRRILDEGEDR